MSFKGEERDLDNYCHYPRQMSLLDVSEVDQEALSMWTPNLGYNMSVPKYLLFKLFLVSFRHLFHVKNALKCLTC